MNENIDQQIVTVTLCTRIKRGWSKTRKVDVTVQEAARLKGETIRITKDAHTFADRFENTPIGAEIYLHVGATLNQHARIAQLSKSAVYIQGDLYADYREEK